MQEELQEELQEEKHEKQTKKQLFNEILRFLIVGGIATIADYFMAYVFYHWLVKPSLVGETWSLIISTAVGFLTGNAVNWILSISFVFKNVKNKKEATSKKSLFLFTVIGLIGLGLTQAGILLGMKLLPTVKLFSTTKFLGEEWKWWICKCVMTCIVLVWNYCGRKLLIFK